MANDRSVQRTGVQLRAPERGRKPDRRCARQVGTKWFCESALSETTHAEVRFESGHHRNFGGVRRLRRPCAEDRRAKKRGRSENDLELVSADAPEVTASDRRRRLERRIGRTRFVVVEGA